MIGEILNNSAISAYQPTSQEVVDFTSYVKKDYDEGIKILNTPYLELNYRSVIEDENRGQLMFNAFVNESGEDPNQVWRWRDTRSSARNKGIAMHAQLTANYLLPLFVAQNEDDEIDQDFSEIMRDIVEWMAEPTNSNYQESFLQIVFGTLTNPATFLGAEFFEIYQKIREKKGQGYTTKYILDEVASGFKCPIWSSSQILITNAYERNIQKQRRIIKRRYVERSELEAKYKDHPNWGFVQSGIKSIYSEEDGLFYDIKDDNHPNLVAEEIALSRKDDNEVPFVNGIYLGNDGIENNPIKHRDNRNAPKYNVIPFGYNRIGEHFFYYKSMMNVVGWDNQLYDAMSEVIMNNAFLEQDPPVGVYGTNQIDSQINFPGAVIAFEQKDVEVKPIFPSKNFVAGFQALRETEKSMEESSISKTMSGQLPEASQKAYSVAQAQANAKRILGGTAKSIAQSILQYGDLMKDIAITKITIPQVEELIGGAMKLKYRSFFLQNKTEGGKMIGRKIKFDESLLGKEMTEKEKEQMSLKLLTETGYPESKYQLSLVNPSLFAKFRYLSKVDIEEMFVKNAEYLQPLLTNLYQMLANDPMIDREGLLRKLLHSYFQSEGDKLILSQEFNPQAQIPQSMVGQMAQNKELSKSVAGMVA